jgi:DNA (cytosine-5)-methyltransferase 1
MKVLSLFSGVGGFDLGLENAGFETVAMCEWDKKAASVLRRHWPHIPIYGDVSDLTGAELVADGVMPDLVAFGSPCQDLSVAGKRAGLAGERSGLFHEAIRIITELRDLSAGTLPRWVIWENVVGALNSNGGEDFRAVLDEMGELGAHLIEWGVLDAQNYGVAQRRRRVFLVACLNSDTARACPEPLLPIRKGRPRDLVALREAWKNSPRTSSESSRGAGIVGIDDRRGGFREFGDVADTLQAFMGTGGGNVPVVMRSIPYTDIVGTLTASDGAKGHTNNQSVSSAMLQVYGISGNVIGRQDHNGPNGISVTEEGGPMFTLTTLDRHAVATPYAVRRLLPIECERLMGWPDDWTRWDAEGKEQTDGHRYKQTGNGVASPVAEWVGRQIFAADAMSNL